MKEIGWGIIGCGNVTEVKSGPAFQLATHSKLVAVMRRNSALAKDYAHRHNVAKWYDNAEALIHDPDVDAVYIATPPSSHSEYTKAVAKAKKPVYVEKPMALNYKECLEMIGACEKSGVPLFVAYYRRAQPRFLKIKSLLDDDAIGKTRFVNVTLYKKPASIDLQGKNHWRVDPKIAGGGYFCDLASHMIDILQYYFGDIEHVAGFTSNQMGLYEAEDMVSATFVFKTGAHGVGVWNFNAYGDVDRTEIIGEKGKITFSTFDDDPVVLENQNGEQKFHIKNPKHVQQPLIQSVVDDLVGKGISPSNGYSASKTNLIMDKILK